MDQRSPNEFDGFDQARHLLWSYESRARILRRLRETAFLDDIAVWAVHVDDHTRRDRAELTAFDEDGDLLATDLLYVDDHEQRLETTPEFDHRLTGLELPVGSELARRAGRDGWILDLDALRAYDHDEDRRDTQRQAFLAHLHDLVGSGDARALMFGTGSELDLGATVSPCTTEGDQHS